MFVHVEARRQLGMLSSSIIQSSFETETITGLACAKQARLVICLSLVSASLAETPRLPALSVRTVWLSKKKIIALEIETQERVYACHQLLP